MCAGLLTSRCIGRRRLQVNSAGCWRIPGFPRVTRSMRWPGGSWRGLGDSEGQPKRHVLNRGIRIFLLFGRTPIPVFPMVKQAQAEYARL